MKCFTKMEKRTKRVCTAVITKIVFCYVIICVLDNLSSSSNQIDYTEITASLQNKFTSKFSPSTMFTNKLSTDCIQTDKVVIGLVYCRGKQKIKGSFYHEQTITMIKSLLISCKLFDISTLEIHLFLEHLMDEQYLRDEIQEKLYFPENESQIQLKLHVHSAVDAVPKKYRNHMVYHPRFRCGYVRFFYPEALPNVDSIIHLDIDMIVTGNIGKHWQLLYEMNENQMLAVSHGRQPANNKYAKVDNFIYKGTPFVPPRGIQSAVLVMNLTRMRDRKMSEKITRVYQDYSQIKGLGLHDMKVLNILLYYKSEIFAIFPCELHFLPNECERGFFCESAYQDPDGLHLMHGNAGRFGKNQIFHPVYKYYLKFNISDPQSNLARDLMKPIQKEYSNSTRRNPCYGVLNKVLFKRFLSISTTSK